MNLLCSLQRFDDALLIASTCQKLDPFNGQVVGVVRDLQEIAKRHAQSPSTQASLAQLEKTARDNPADLQAAFNLAGAYLQRQQTTQALHVLEGILNHPKAEAAAFHALIQAYSSFNYLAGVQQTADKLEALVRADPANFAAANTLAEAYRRLQKPDAALRTLDGIVHHPKVTANAAVQAAQQCAALGDSSRMEAALQKVTQLAPDLAEAWYDLAALQTATGKSQPALASLRRALELSAKRKATDPDARDLAAAALTDASFSLSLIHI